MDLYGIEDGKSEDEEEKQEQREEASCAFVHKRGAIQRAGEDAGGGGHSGARLRDAGRRRCAGSEGAPRGGRSKAEMALELPPLPSLPSLPPSRRLPCKYFSNGVVVV